ncbi:hypothetical protein TDMWS_16570 [Thermodesulfomicrobium sp. WS]|uniref:hypothetical protein n=1 Tax=Thermodesulfomicrobium sp. WS TaxID=3004129 RepID=UPI00249219DC|nr:hypothetical protein [Thermodesulfomicrobium sp. WS]BDV01572.1 hypothetical protein TDMWS_16570 [Thermodesulfomicrobium sp. WS]
MVQVDAQWQEVTGLDRQTVGAMVVTKTLNTMHQWQRQHRGASSLYDFQQDVLLPVYTGRGTIMDSWG